MAKFTVGQAVVTTEDCFSLPAGTQGIVEKIHWELPAPNIGGVQGCYEVWFPERSLPHFANEETVWNYYDMELAPVKTAIATKAKVGG